jgi:general secretion pathway protein M
MERRLIAVLLLVILLGAVVAAVFIAAKRAHAEYDATIQSRLEQIARFKRIAATRVQYERLIASVKAKDVAKYFLKTSSPALAAADIQQTAQAVAEANGLHVESVVIVGHKDQDFHRQVTLNLRVRGKLNGVQHALYSLEMAQPYLFIDNVSMQSTVRSNYVPIPSVEPDVMAQFDIYGYAYLKKNNDAQARH